MVDPTLALLVASGAIGYAIGRDGKTVVPVTANDLQASKPTFEKKLEIDTSVAHDEATKNWEYNEEGNLIYVVNPTTPTTTVYARFNEPDAPDWDLTALRKIRFPFYRFFITNTAGSGTLEIRVARGLQVEPYEGVVSTVGSVLNAIGDVAAGSPSDDDVLGYVTSTGYWTSVAITEIAGFAAHKARHQDGGLDEISLTNLAGDPTDTINESILTAQNDIILRGASEADRLNIGASRIVARLASGNVVAATGAQVIGLLTGANLDVGAFDVRGQTVTADALTSGRVVFVGANGVLSDDGDFLFATDTLTVTKIGAFQATGAINFGSQNMTNVDIDSGTLDGVTITSPTINGTIGTTGLTMPAQTLGGALNVGAQNITSVASFEADATHTMYTRGKRTDNDWSIVISTPGAGAGYTNTNRVRFNGRAAETGVHWTDCTHIGIKLGGALNANGNILQNVNYVQLDEITTPGAVASHGALYTKTDDKLYFQDGAGAEHELAKLDIAAPSGLIAMWHGTIANIPTGWIICDGNNGTPNLLAKFVEGVATAATDPGATGGALLKTTDSSGEAAKESGATATAPVHTHEIADIRPPYYDVAFIMKT